MKMKHQDNEYIIIDTKIKKGLVMYFDGYTQDYIELEEILAHR